MCVLLIFSIVLAAGCKSQRREAPARRSPSLPPPGPFSAVSCARCGLYPRIRLGNGDLINELGLLGWRDLASDYSSSPIPPIRFSPLRRGSRILEAKMFIMDCSVRTWEAETGKEKSFSLGESG